MNVTDIVERLTEYADTLTLPHGGEIMHEAAREIERLRSTIEWQPIETAPRGNRYILTIVEGRHPETGVPYVPVTAKYDLDLGEWITLPNQNDFEETADEFTPTHWRPLPPPPVKEGE